MRLIVLSTACVSALLFAAAGRGHVPQASSGGPPRVLIVTAHPDDDAAFAGTVYKITHELNGLADLVLVTDGRGGYRYATLAEPFYGLRLTDEAVARQHLPGIRKRELMAGGRIVGISNYYFLDEPDHGYTLSADTVLRHVWDTAYVKRRLGEIIRRGRYDFLFVLLPREDTHGHHKAAAIAALETVQQLRAIRRPVVLGGFPYRKDSVPSFTGLPSHPVTRVRGGAPLGGFDLTRPIGHDGRLNYKIVVNWVIAEHKSQGTMQLLVNYADVERYWYFEVNGPEREAEAAALFQRLGRGP